MGPTNTRNELLSAIENGEVLLINYHGGSRPGTFREIAPGSFVGDSKVRAFCCASDQDKVFFISKIEIIDSVDAKTQDYKTAQPPEEPKSLTVALNNRIESLRIMGWHVDITTQSCSLHYYFKNGKPRKTPTVSIQFDEFIIDYYYDPATDEDVEEKRKSTRPWHVYCRDTGYSSGFSSLRKATEKFIDFAELTKPTDN